jgi:hypothetical protein
MPWRYDFVMPDYRRAHVPGGTYFFTVSIDRRQTFLTDAAFHRYVKQGWLPANWGSNIESLSGADFGK